MNRTYPTSGELMPRFPRLFLGSITSDSDTGENDG